MISHLDSRAMPSTKGTSRILGLAFTHAALRGLGRFLRRDLWLDWPIARPLRIKAKRKTGIARFIHRGGRLPRLHRRGPFEHSLRALATKSRTGRHVGAWWRRPQARKEHSSPTLPNPGGSTPNLGRLTLYCPCGVRGRGSDCPIAVTWGSRLPGSDLLPLRGLNQVPRRH